MSKTEYRYWRMDAQGNAFLILDARDGKPLPSPNQVRALAEKARKEKKPFDQLLVLEPSRNAYLFMRIFNQDGGEVEACGNGACAVARLSIDALGKRYESGYIETPSAKHGIVMVTRSNSGIHSVGMGVRYPRFGWRDIPLEQEVPNTEEVSLDPPVFAGGEELPPFFAVNVGNPHAVFFFDAKEKMPSLEKVGEKLEHHPIFPKRANISFASVDGTEITAWRVWERGVGITKSCGTAACAVVVAAIKTGRLKRESSHFVRVSSSQGGIRVRWLEKSLFLLVVPQYAYETESAKDVHHLTLEA